MRTPLTAGVGPGRISGRGGEGRAPLRTHRLLTRISSPPRAPVGTVWSGVTSSLSRTGLGRPRRSATFSPLNTREDSFSPTSYPSPRSAGIRLPVAAYSSGRDMDRNCGWGPGGGRALRSGWSALSWLPGARFLLPTQRLEKRLKVLPGCGEEGEKGSGPRV